eukprot:Skav228360  [mRNA]  locus=scaffold1981:49161:69074:+ [translate_table: standard]
MTNYQPPLICGSALVRAMDDMVFALKKEQADEVLPAVKQKDFCGDEFRKNQLQTEEKTRTKEALFAKEQAIDIAKPKSDIETLLDAELRACNWIQHWATKGRLCIAMESEIADMKKQLQKAEQNREKDRMFYIYENADFQKVIAEQRQTQGLLKEGAFLQGSQQAPEAPGGFKDYKANGKSFGVMSMLQQLVEDAKAMEAEAVRAENSAQTAYEAFAKDTTESVSKKEHWHWSTLVQTRESREGQENELETLQKKLAELHASWYAWFSTMVQAKPYHLPGLGLESQPTESPKESCDFLMKNFDARQSAREEELRSSSPVHSADSAILGEMDSVKKAKAILSGAACDAAGAQQLVLTLLQGMKDQLEKEASEEEELMDKYKCWCKEMEAKVSELSANSARLAVEYKNLGKDVVKNEESMDEVMALRKKQLATFQADELDLLNNIQSVESASDVINGTSVAFVQLSQHTAISQTLQKILARPS